MADAVFFISGQHTGEHRRIHPAGRNRIDADAVPAVFHRGILCHADDGPFAGTVADFQRIAEHARYRAEVDDRTFFLFLHDRQYLRHHQIRSKRIDLINPAERLERIIFRPLLRSAPAGRIHERVDATPFRHDFFDRLFHRPFIGHVRRDNDGAIARKIKMPDGFLSERFVDVHDGDLGAFFIKLPYQHTADAELMVLFPCPRIDARAGDDDNLIFKIHVRLLFLFDYYACMSFLSIYCTACFSIKNAEIGSAASAWACMLLSMRLL